MFINFALWKLNNMSLNKDIKIIVVGSPGVGKTSYVNKWTKNIFSNKYKPTITSDFSCKIYEDGEKLYRIQLWDLAGQDSGLITKIFAKDAHGCVIISDATNILIRDE